MVNAMVEYLLKLAVFGATAFGGILLGIHLRKRKDKKEELKGNE